jgi:hypothetical protein
MDKEQFTTLINLIARDGAIPAPPSPPLTRESFLALANESHTPLPIRMADGRMGLCNHWTATHVLVDAYRGNEGEQVHVAYSSIVHVGGGALKELVTR